MNKKIMVLFSGISLLLILVSFTSAFAVSSKYWEEKALELYPGETREVPIFLQNMNGDKDLVVQTTFIQPAGIAKLLGSSDRYDVPLGQKTQVDVSFTVPENAAVGKSYSVVLSFKILDESEGQILGIGTSIEKIIPVVIVPKPISGKGQFTTSLMLILSILVVLLLIVLVLWKILSRKKFRR